MKARTSLYSEEGQARRSRGNVFSDLLSSEGEEVPIFKGVLVGDAGTGMTTFVKCHLTGDFEDQYIATQGVARHPLVFHTNRCPVSFNVWDTADKEKLRGPRDGYFILGQDITILLDVTSPDSSKTVANWYRDLTQVVGTSKMDIMNRKVIAKNVVFQESDFVRVRRHAGTASTRYPDELGLADST